MVAAFVLLHFLLVARMGTWGIETFEDDIAVDWLEDLFDSHPVAFLRHCLDLTGHDYLGHVACIGIVCSSEMIHGLLCEPRSGMPEQAYEWLREHANLDAQPFVADAITGLGRVLGPSSEMRELWEDDGERFELWRSRVQDLVERLGAVATPEG